MEAVLEEPFILLYEKRIGTSKDSLSILEQIAKMREASPKMRSAKGM